MMTIRWLILGAALFFSTCAFARTQAPARDTAHSLAKLAKVLDCSEKLTKELNSSIGNPPHVEDLKGVVHWIRTHLPPYFQHALENSANDAMSIAAPEGLSGLSKSNGKLLYRLMLINAFRGLSDTAEWRGTPCGNAVSFQVSEYLDSWAYKLRGTSAYAELQRISKGDSTLEGRILLVMVTLDATEVSWKISWLSEAVAAQREWPGKNSNIKPQLPR